MKKKVLYVISSLTACGPVNVMLEIIKNQNKDVFDIYILALSRAKKNDITAEFEKEGVTCLLLEMSRINTYIHGVKRIKLLVDKIRPHIIHTHCIRSTYFIGKIATNAKKIVTIHNYPHLDYKFGYGPIIGTIAGYFMLNSIKKFDIRIACSKSISDELKEKYNIDTIYIRNGVRENDKYNKRSVIRKSLGLTDNDLMVISVGSLSERKNPIYILEQAKKLKNKNIKLIFLGDGPQKNKCRNYQNNNIIFLGNIPNVDDYMAAADIYVSASKAEGLPLSVLEALSAGVPVLLSNIAPHREILDVSKNTMGYIFNLSLDGDFLDKIGCLENKSTREKLSMNAKNNFVNYFDDHIMGKAYEKIYIKY